jgi:hypothetical protein
VDAAIEEEASKAVLAGQEVMTLRLSEVAKAIEANDAKRINGLLRRLFEKIVVDVEAKTITAQWIGEAQEVHSHAELARSRSFSVK